MTISEKISLGRLGQRVIIVLIFLFLAYEVVALPWVKALLKVGEQQFFIVFYFLLLLFFILALLRIIFPLKTIYVVLAGFVVGQIAGMFALILYTLSTPEGTFRILNSIDRFAAGGYIASLLWGTLALGSGPLGTIALVVTCNVVRPTKR